MTSEPASVENAAADVEPSDALPATEVRGGAATE